ARRLRAEGRQADVVIANNVMAHTPDLNGFVEGLGMVLADEGLLTVENPYVRDLIAHGEFDTIYHEHFSYFSCTAVANLMKRHGLSVNHVEYFPLHGGTLRWHVERPNAAQPSALAYLEAELEQGVVDIPFYTGFAAQVHRIKQELLALLRSLKEEHRTVAAYGAAAKGSTLLNYMGIGRDLVGYVVDRSVHKQGHFMPGVHLPIHDPSMLLEDAPDFVLLLAWNFRDEILRQQEEFRRRGGRFIVPVPFPEIV
ncbi:MAG: class I SAM-dependent methyltransferase, partial [Actinomycetota bacterium]|nr:class I SAM-dependent methyltransferase [Actinomycetota bacterium]